MIYVSHSLPVNEPGQVTVNRDDLWRGLVAKAGNALPFVAASDPATADLVRRVIGSSFTVL